MSVLRFNPTVSSLIVEARLEGKFAFNAHFILDTGASIVVLPWRLATGLGLSIDPKRLLTTATASAVESVPQTVIPRMTVLGKKAKNVACIIKDLPPESGVDGLLGLSFLRHFKLAIDFKKGILKLE